MGMGMSGMCGQGVEIGYKNVGLGVLLCHCRECVGLLHPSSRKLYCRRCCQNKEQNIKQGRSKQNIILIERKKFYVEMLMNGWRYESIEQEWLEKSEGLRMRAESEYVCGYRLGKEKDKGKGVEMEQKMRFEEKKRKMEKEKMEKRMKKMK